MKTCDDCFIANTDACPYGGRTNDDKICDAFFEDIPPTIFDYLKAIPNFKDRGVKHTTPCPCGGTITAIRSTCNGHLHAECDTCDFKLHE